MIVERVSAERAREIVLQPGVRETFFGRNLHELPDDPRVHYLLCGGGIVIFSPVNSAAHAIHVAFPVERRKRAAQSVRATIEWFREQGGACVVALIPKMHRAAVGIAWNVGFRLCGRIRNGCESGDLLIFEDGKWA